MPYMNRKHVRLKDFDYSKEYAYFITICTKNREKILWKNQDVFELNRIGKIVEECWIKIPQIYHNILYVRKK